MILPNPIRLSRIQFRFGWNESLASSIEYWSQRDASFDCLIGTELLSTNGDESIKRIAVCCVAQEISEFLLIESIISFQSIMKPEAKVVLLEPVDDVAEQPIKEVRLSLFLLIFR